MNVKQVPSACPNCGGGLWDNRGKKKNPKAPDFKCKNKGCDGCYWPPSAKDRFQWADEASGTPLPPQSSPAAPALNAVERYWILFDETLDKLNARAAGMKIGGEMIPVDLSGVNAIVATQFIAERNR